MLFFGKQLRIGTRGSKLALWQARFVQDKLRQFDIDSEIVAIKTEGDRIDKPLYSFGGKGLFVKALEEALLEDKIDIAVHSLKDMSVFMDARFDFVVLKRDDWRDVLVSNKGPLFELPPGSRIGTTSLRRRSELYRLRDDLEFVDLRGNLDTRLKKLKAGQIDAIVVSKAGLLRLNLYDETCMYGLDGVVPSAGQGVIAVEFLKSVGLYEFVDKLEDRKTRLCIDAERSFVAQLNASCNYPIGAHAYFVGGRFCMDVMYGFEDDITKQLRCSFCSSSMVEVLAHCVNEIRKGL